MPRKIYTNIPQEELMRKIRNARRSIQNKESRTIKCYHCGHSAFTVYAESTGYIENKCRKCNKLVLVDLINMRRLNKK